MTVLALLTTQLMVVEAADTHTSLRAHRMVGESAGTAGKGQGAGRCGMSCVSGLVDADAEVQGGRQRTLLEHIDAIVLPRGVFAPSNHLPLCARE